MPSPSPEQLFARYRDAGDLAALAAVFDAMAGELLLVAAHLVRDGALAEDLVQTTFVEAMGSAARYDGRRRLMPWLAGILTHHARKLHRRRRRDEQLRLGAPREADITVGQVLGRETMAVVEAGLAQLPGHYRQVLMLRLVHDLTPTAIAHALGCPPETVKTRLRRGLGLLRRHLPSGIATTLAMAFATGRGLAAVRADVLQVGSELAARSVGAGVVAAGMLAFGGLMMKQFLVWATVVVAVLALGWYGMRVSGLARTNAQPAEPGTLLVGEMTTGSALAGATNERTPLVEAAPAAEGLVFVGRCVAADGGAPLTDVPVRVWVEGMMPRPADHQPDDADVCGRAQSGSDGSFRCACDRFDGIARPPGTALVFSVQVGGPGHVPRTRVFGPYDAPREVDLGEVRLQTGIRLTSRVVDLRGQPVAGIAVVATAFSAMVVDEPLREQVALRSRSDDRGRITWPHGVRPGCYQLYWEHSATLPPEREFASRMEVSGEPADQDNVLVWPAEDVAHAIRGVVVDESGAPVRLLALIAEGGGTRGHAQTDDYGRFLVPRVGPFDAGQRGPVGFRLLRPTDGFELTAEVACQWGAHDVRVVVRPAAKLLVRPIDPRTGKPPVGFEIAFAAVSDGAAPDVVRRAPERLADGAVLLPCARCPHVVQVFPRDPELAPSRRLDWEPRHGEELVVQLTRAVPRIVRVVTEDGRPVAGCEVWTFLPVTATAGAPAAPGWREIAVPEPDDFDPTMRWANFGIGDAPMVRARTDAGGRVALRVPAEDDVVIAALGPGHVPKAVVGRPGGDGEIELRVVRGASIRLDVTPAELVAHLSPSPQRQRLLSIGGKTSGGSGVQLHIIRAIREQDPQRPQPVVMAAVDAGGRYECAGLPPGTYDLALSGKVQAGSADGVEVRWPFATVTLHAGEARTLSLDVSRLATGRLRGTVLLNGRPWAFGGCSLMPRPADDAPRSHTVVEVVTDALGRFEVETVQGEHRLTLKLRHRRGEAGIVFAAERASIDVGATTDVVFTARNVTARVHVAHADGQPAVGSSVTVQCQGEPRRRQPWVIDAEGWITIEGAPLVPFELVVASADGPVKPGRRGQGTGDVVLGPFTVPPTGDQVELRAQLPEGWR